MPVTLMWAAIVAITILFITMFVAHQPGTKVPSGYGWAVFGWLGVFALGFGWHIKLNSWMSLAEWQSKVGVRVPPSSSSLIYTDWHDWSKTEAGIAALAPFRKKPQ